MRGANLRAWWMYPTGLAILLHIVITQFFPRAIAVVPWIDPAWPERIQHIALLLGLIAIGVVAPGVWWLLRRTIHSR